jgi:hypothetical protein
MTQNEREEEQRRLLEARQRQQEQLAREMEREVQRVKAFIQSGQSEKKSTEKK